MTDRQINDIQIAMYASKEYWNTGRNKEYASKIFLTKATYSP